MTKKLSITVPDDVAAYLAELDNVSAEVTEAIQVRMRSRRVAKVLADAGLVITAEGMARMRERRLALRAQRGQA